jgi:hypothetical protein
VVVGGLTSRRAMFDSNGRYVGSKFKNEDLKKKKKKLLSFMKEDDDVDVNSDDDEFYNRAGKRTPTSPA